MQASAGLASLPVSAITPAQAKIEQSVASRGRPGPAAADASPSKREGVGGLRIPIEGGRTAPGIKLVRGHISRKSSPGAACSRSSTGRSQWSLPTRARRMAMLVLLRALAEAGATPASRSRIEIEPDGGEPDEWDEILNG